MTEVLVPATFTLIFLIPEFTLRYPVLDGKFRAALFFLLLSTRRSTPGASGDAWVIKMFALSICMSSVVLLQEEKEKIVAIKSNDVIKGRLRFCKFMFIFFLVRFKTKLCNYIEKTIKLIAYNL
jgi:hypothetical protein